MMNHSLFYAKLLDNASRKTQGELIRGGIELYSGEITARGGGTDRADDCPDRVQRFVMTVVSQDERHRDLKLQIIARRYIALEVKEYSGPAHIFALGHFMPGRV
jgi:hypothetical protein